MKRILKLAIYGIAAIAALSSCSKNEDVPSQKDIETKIIGKWKETIKDGEGVLTNERLIKTFFTNLEGTYSSSKSFFGEYAWCNKIPIKYEIKGNDLCEKSVVQIFAKVLSIDESRLYENDYKIITHEGEEISVNTNLTYEKVTADYSQDIIGMWEGVEMTGDETYGDANHRIYYKEDGTYTYYDKVGDSWVPSKNAGNEYNVDGDWLATRWQPTEGADYEYEWWDIVEIKDGTMKWSALREKGDGTRYTTTFTWKKVNLPTQEEIEAKIIGKWKTTTLDGKDILTNNRIIRTFTSNHKVTHSTSHYSDGTYLWFNKIPLQYDVVGNELHEISEETSMKVLSKILSIDETQFLINIFKIISPDSKELSNSNSGFQKVTADYSQDIIGMWEGVEMTGDETYGDANHRIEYKADGTYTYYDKVGDSWVPSKNAGNEYNVDGDWLATRWQPTEGADYEYEWWDIVEIKDGTMKWSALREKGDKTRYTTTFTWKKVNLPTQEEIETKIIGKWKSTSMNGKEDLTNNKVVKTFFSNNKSTHSTSRYYNGKFIWQNKVPHQYEIKGNDLTENLGEDGTLRLLLSKVTSINEATLCYHFYKSITPEEGEKAENDNSNFQKVTADYSEAIIGLWEGVEMTGDETYGDANHRIEYKADGTYVYYDKDGDDWKLSEDVDNEYNVDGDWLASRWRPKAGEDFEYEWWDIDEIKDGTMKWSALREKEDGTRYTTTFTWKKIQLQ